MDLINGLFNVLKETFEFAISNRDTVLTELIQHIKITALAAFLSCLVSIPVGFLVSNNKKISKIVMNISNVIQTIPSIALFALTIPILNIGFQTAVFALFLYGLMPILKNTIIGVNSVDTAIIQAAKGMGMNRWETLYIVKIPIAMPIIMGGVRISIVTGIGIATIASLIGAGGLGSFIFSGLSSMDIPKILTGAITAALLAIFADLILGLVEKALTSKGLR